jgi:hypothetical protein
MRLEVKRGFRRLSASLEMPEGMVTLVKVNFVCNPTIGR